MYSSTFRRTASGRFGDERMRLRTTDEGPYLLSRLSSAQAVFRLVPSARACWAVVQYPAAISALRISVSLEVCLFFACNCKLASGFADRVVRLFRVAARSANTVTLLVVMQRIAAMHRPVANRHPVLAGTKPTG